MTKRTWPIDVTPDSTTLTLTNLKATDGTAATTISGGSGGTVRSTTANVHNGTAAMRTVSGSTAPLDVRLPLTPNAKQGISGYRSTPTLLLSSIPIILRDTAGTALIRITINSTGHIQLQSGSGANRGSASTATITEARYNRLDIVADIGASSTTGSCTVNIFNGDATGTPDVTATATGVDFGGTGANSLGFISLGMLLTGAATQDWDTWVTDDGATVAPGPYSATNLPPVVSLTANQDVAAAASVSATATASDPDGTVASYAWTGTRYTTSAAPAAITITSGASTATASWTSGAAGSLDVMQCVVTDNNGATTTVTTESRVPLASGANAGILIGTSTGNTWTLVGSAATEGAALNDTDDTTYVESPVFVSTGSSRRYRIAPMGPQSALTGTSRSKLTALGGTVKVRIREGSVTQTLRQEWDVTQGTSFADQTLSVTTPGAISDFNDLWVEFYEST